MIKKYLVAINVKNKAEIHTFSTLKEMCQFIVSIEPRGISYQTGFYEVCK